MTLLHIDSLSEMGTAKRAVWSALGTNATGRDGSANGAVLLGTSTMLTVTAAAGIIVGVAYHTTALTNSSIIAIYGDSRVTQHLTVTINATTGLLELRRGTATGTLLGSSPSPLPINEWHYIELKATVDDSTGTGTVQLDGVQVIDYTGDTKNAGTATNIDGISIGRSPSSTGNHTWDDMYVMNYADGTATQGRPNKNFQGDVKVERRIPNGNGAASTWIGSDGNSTDNYLLVDENPANTTDYTGRVSTSTGDRDLYTVEDLVAASPLVIAVQPVVYAAKSDAGTGNIKTVARQSTTTVSTSASIPLSTTYAWYDGPLLTRDPDVATWTAALVNSMQVGVEVA